MSLNIEFIQNDKHRLTIFEDLAKGELSEEQLVSKNHLSLETVKEALHAMENEGLAGWKGDVHFLTDKGRKLALEIGKNSHLDSAPVKHTQGKLAKGEKFPGHDYKRR